jgi:hypothetical protein
MRLDSKITDIFHRGTNTALCVRNYIIQEDYIFTFILKFCADKMIIFRFSIKCACSLWILPTCFDMGLVIVLCNHVFIAFMTCFITKCHIAVLWINRMCQYSLICILCIWIYIYMCCTVCVLMTICISLDRWNVKINYNYNRMWLYGLTCVCICVCIYVCVCIFKFLWRLFTLYGIGAYQTKFKIGTK